MTKQQLRVERQSIIEVNKKLLVMYDINVIILSSTTENNQSVRKKVWYMPKLKY